MSVVDESNDSVFQTPDSVVLIEERAVHPELDNRGQETQDIGAFPVLGPVTRSGRKRKHTIPVKSSGKKKTKMIRSPGTATGAQQAGCPTPTQGTAPAPDFAQLLTMGLADIKSSMGGMENRLGGKIDALEETVKKNEGKIEELTATVESNSTELCSLRRRTDATESTIDRRIEETLQRLTANDSLSVTSISTDQTGHHQSRSAQQTSSYWKCRRSLRLWPIKNDGSLEGNVKSFLTGHLGFDLNEVDGDFGTMRVERVIDPRSKIKFEAIVEFATPALRDSIKGSGYKLEGKQAGIRMEIPNFLKSDFHVLQSISYKMKMAHPGLKRSVKFDDEHLGLILDIQIPGQDWRRIRPDQARAAGAANPALIRSGPQELSGNMIANTIREGHDAAPSPLTGANATPLS